MATRYEIRVKGHLPQDWSAWFEGLTIIQCPNGETVLAGPLRDQAALFGVMIELLYSQRRSTRRVPDPSVCRWRPVNGLCDRAIRRARRPQRIQALILATPPTAWETRSEQSAMYEQMAALVDSQGTSGLAAMMAQQAPAMIPPLLLEVAPNMGGQMASNWPPTMRARWR